MDIISNQQNTINDSNIGSSIPTREEWINVISQCYLEIDEIHTGNSLQFRLKEGWKPELRTINGDFEIAIPRKLGIPGIILFFLLSSVKYGTGIYNDILDSKLKQIEIEIKDSELYMKMEESKRSKPHLWETKRQARRTINFILENPDIEYFEINGIEIKNDKDTLPNIN